MSVRVRVCEGIAPEWERLAAGGSLLTSPGWLRAMAGRLGDRVLTFVVSKDGTACLAAYASVQAAPQPQEFFDLHNVLVTEVRGLPLTESARAARAEFMTVAPAPDRWAPYLLFMLPGYECLPVGPGAGDPVLLNSLVEAALRWAGQEGMAAAAFLYLRPQQAALAGALAANGFTGVPLSVTWDLPVPADGMAGYLRALPSTRRRKVVRELSKLAEAGVVLRPLDRGEAADDREIARLAGLRCHLIRKYRRQADDAAERRRLESLITDVCRGEPLVIAARAGDETVGFAMFSAGGTAWHCISAGYDYADPRSAFCYFGTMYYGVVPVAAAAGAATIGYGQGAADTKRSRGCVGTPLTAWVWSADQDLADAIRASAAMTAISMTD